MKCMATAIWFAPACQQKIMKTDCWYLKKCRLKHFQTAFSSITNRLHRYTYLDYNFKKNELNQYPYSSFFSIPLFIYPIEQADFGDKKSIHTLWCHSHTGKQINSNKKTEQIPAPFFYLIRNPNLEFCTGLVSHIVNCCFDFIIAQTCITAFCRPLYISTVR